MAQMVAPFTVRRLAHHRSRSLSVSYYHQPRLSSNWDGTKVGWASNMGYNAGTVAYADIWVAELNVNAPAPVASGLVPDNAAAGSVGFVLTVNGSNFVPQSVVQWNGANRVTTYVGATQLQTTLTAADLATAGTASVTVLTPAPGGGTSGTLTFTITASANPLPAVTSLSPTGVNAGAAAFALTVNGSGFVGGSVVEWNGAARATTFVSSTQLQAAVLAADVATAGTAPVDVTSPAPGGGTSGGLAFSINTPPNPVPAVTSLSPTSANAGGAAFTLVVNGTSFVAGSVVQWNGNARTTTFVSATRLRAAITAADLAMAGTAAVRVFSPSPGGGTSSALTFTINIPPNPVPTISSLSPSSASAGTAGITLIVSGTNFVAASVVDWNGSPRATMFVSAVELHATILAADIAPVGTAAVTVLSPTPGRGTSNTSTFTINTPP